MPEFSKTSEDRLLTCDDRLVLLFHTVVKTYDCTVMEGFRDQATQDKYFAEGKSKKKWPEGEHNHKPSHAVDVAPCIGGKPSFDSRQCCHFAGYVLAVAQWLGIQVRWGGDWDMDGEVMSDQTFQDLVHFEVR